MKRIIQGIAKGGKAELIQILLIGAQKVVQHRWLEGPSSLPLDQNHVAGNICFDSYSSHSITVACSDLSETYMKRWFVFAWSISFTLLIENLSPILFVTINKLGSWWVLISIFLLASFQKLFVSLWLDCSVININLKFSCWLSANLLRIGNENDLHSPKPKTEKIFNEQLHETW